MVRSDVQTAATGCVQCTVRTYSITSHLVRRCCPRFEQRFVGRAERICGLRVLYRAVECNLKRALGATRAASILGMISPYAEDLILDGGRTDLHLHLGQHFVRCVGPSSLLKTSLLGHVGRRNFGLEVIHALFRVAATHLPCINTGELCLLHRIYSSAR